MKYSLIALTALALAIGKPGTGQSPTILANERSSSSVAIDSSASAASGLRERNPRYRLRRGDTFDLDFELSPEFNQTVAVEPDGYINLKGVGAIFVEGKTMPEVTEICKTSYATILHNPIITITLKDFEKPYFIAAGQVSKPGKYDLRSDLTITEGVAIAGGFNDKAKHSQVVLFRPTAGGYEAKIVNVKKLLASHDLSEDIHLQPGDMLYVPQSAFSRIRPFLPNSSMSMYVNPVAY